ncbi:hypothetical protein BC830DRAFT_336021 [Chytriomyces sp. MP71]|nr:hypothetical protein BC830DRAFT_336021 [Chytriomyces sp. MP71]
MQSMANVPLISTFCGPSSPYWALYNGGSTLPSIRCGCQLFALANQVDNSNCSRMCYSSSAYCGSLSQSTQAGTPVYFAVYKNANYDMTNATSCFLSDPKNCGSIGWQCLDSSSCVNGACYKPGGGSSTTGNSTTLNGGSSGSNSTSSGGSSGNTSGSSTAGNNTGSAGGGPAGNNGSGTLSDTCNGKQCPVDYPKCWMGGCINPNISNSACGIDMKPCSFDKPNCIGGTCKNILTDANNCGSLGHKCGNQLPDCSNGTCTNYQSDNTNCGKAGAICDLDQNQICSGGTCKSLDDQNIVTPCVPLPDGTNLMECQNYGACTPHGQCIINPNNNPQFCGTLIPASGISCLGPNPICLLGKCFNTVPAPNNTCTQTCPSANSTCYNKVCIDLNNDPYNCGKLSNVCPSTSPTCVYGSCTNTLTDKNNCGAPNNVCPPLAPNCSVGFCNNIMNDTSNCGMHGNQCDGSQGVCIQGKCSCVTGWALDPTSSVNGCFKPNLLTDPKNCGTIGNLCKDYTWYCGNGTCINPSSNPQFCGTMLSPVVACVLPNPDCANGACTNFASSSLNCGSTGNKCGGGSSCSGGVCTCSSGLSYITTAKNCVPQDCAILVTTFPSIWDGKTSCCNQNPKPGVNVICNSNNGVTDL